MLCEEFFQGHIVFIDFRGRACRGDLVPAVRKNRHRGIGDWRRRRFHRLGRCDAGVQRTCSSVGGEAAKRVPFVANDKDGTDGAGKSGDDATTVIAPPESEGEQTKTLSAEESDETTVMTSVDGDTTTAMPATSGRVISSTQAGGRESNMLPDNAGGSIQHAGRRASFDAWLHGKRAPIVIAIVSALIGVAVSAGLILAFTGGHGTDTVVRDMVNSKQTPSDDNAGDSTYGSGNNGTQDNMQNQSGTTDTDKDSTTNSDRNNGKDTGRRRIPQPAAPERPPTARTRPPTPETIRTRRIRPRTPLRHPTDRRQAPTIRDSRARGRPPRRMVRHPRTRIRRRTVRIPMARHPARQAMGRTLRNSP